MKARLNAPFYAECRGQAQPDWCRPAVRFVALLVANSRFARSFSGFSSRWWMPEPAGIGPLEDSHTKRAARSRACAECGCAQSQPDTLHPCRDREHSS